MTESDTFAGVAAVSWFGGLNQGSGHQQNAEQLLPEVAIEFRDVQGIFKVPMHSRYFKVPIL